MGWFRLVMGVKMEGGDMDLYMWYTIWSLYYAASCVFIIVMSKENNDGNNPNKL